MNSRNRAAFVLVLLLSFGAASTASAVLLVASNGSTLTRFDSATPGTVSTVAVSGLQAGESLVGLDFRPANGKLYGVGNSGRLYVLNLTTGAAAQVGSGATFNASGGTYGSDFDNLTDRLRVVSNTGLNILINPDTGGAVEHPPLKDNSPTNNISGIGYTNSYNGATTTTLYGIGSVTGQLVRIGIENATTPASVNNGEVTPIGSLGVGNGLNQNIGFDIAPDGIAYAAIFSGSLRLYTVNLQTGAAALVGQIGDGVTTFRGLAVQSGPATVSNSTQILVPATGTGGAGGAPSSPYPSGVSVAGLVGETAKVRLTLHDVRHKYPGDIDVLLVAPDGRKMVIMSDSGGDVSTCGVLCDNGSNLGSTGVTLTFDDAAAATLPSAGALTTGTFKPTDHPHEAEDGFPSPAPAGPYAEPAPSGTATFAKAFNGGNPNGTWSLYVTDDNNTDTGRIFGGWTLEVTSAPPASARLANISTRLRVGKGDNALIGGFIITGTDPKKVIVRALGPSLPLDDRLPNPKLTVFNSDGKSFGSNDNWKQSPQKQDILDSKIPPENDLEAAVVQKLPVDAYTAVVSGVNGATGVGLVEAYDLSPDSHSKLANISTRGLVQTGDNVLIAGFIVTGNAELKLIIRALGPSLPFANKLKDPMLEIFNEDGMKMAANDNWRSTQESAIKATGIPPENNKEAAFVGNARPGAYTVKVRGVGDTTGVGIVEVYALD